MTESSESSATAESRPLPAAPPQKTGVRWLAAIAALGVVVVALNVALFLLVQEHQQSIERRETAVERRENDLAARIEQRQSILEEIDKLNAQRLDAEIAKDTAEAQATDADTKRKQHVQLLKEVAEAQGKLTEAQAALKGVNQQVADQAAAVERLIQERAQLQKEQERLAQDLRELERDTEEARKVAADADAERAKAQSKLDQVKLIVEQLDNQQRLLAQNLDDVGDQLVAAEDELAATKRTSDDLVQRADGAEARAAVAEARLDAANKDVSIAEEERARLLAEEREINDRLALLKPQLVDIEQRLPAAREDMDSLKVELEGITSEIKRLEARRSQITIDEAVAQEAAKARIEAEDNLAKAKGELSSVQMQIADTRAELSRLSDMRDALSVDEERFKQLRELIAQRKEELVASEEELELLNEQIVRERVRLAEIQYEIEHLSSSSKTGETPALQPKDETGEATAN